MGGCRGRVWSSLGRAFRAAVAGCHVGTSWQRWGGGRWAKSEWKRVKAGRAELAAVVRAGWGGPRGRGWLSQPGARGQGTPLHPWSSAAKAVSHPAGIWPDALASVCESKEQGAQGARLENIGRRRKRGGEEKNISKSEK